MSEALELEDIQGLVARGYGSLVEARFVLLAIADPILARAWIGGLAERVTPGTARPEDRAGDFTRLEEDLAAPLFEPDAQTARLVQSVQKAHDGRQPDSVQRAAELAHQVSCASTSTPWRMLRRAR